MNSGASPETTSVPAFGRTPATPDRETPVQPAQPHTATWQAPVTGADRSHAVSALPAALISASLDKSPLGDVWSQTVNQLVTTDAVAALTRELALQSQLCTQAGGVWTLRVERESLNQSAAREKLQLALQTALGDAAIRVSVEIGAVTDSPARRNAAALAERQRAAEESIHNDPFVQDMIRDWGAKIVPGSIKPITPRPI